LKAHSKEWAFFYFRCSTSITTTHSIASGFVVFGATTTHSIASGFVVFGETQPTPSRVGLSFSARPQPTPSRVGLSFSASGFLSFSASGLSFWGRRDEGGRSAKGVRRSSSSIRVTNDLGAGVSMTACTVSGGRVRVVAHVGSLPHRPVAASERQAVMCSRPVAGVARCLPPREKMSAVVCETGMSRRVAGCGESRRP
jgi:hypothetical protein